jgi:hypothetical protein
MAGPHVVGAVALLLSARPDLRGNPDAVMELVKQRSVPTTSSQNCGAIPGRQVPNNTFGYGLLDTYQMVKTVL